MPGAHDNMRCTWSAAQHSPGALAFCAPQATPLPVTAAQFRRRNTVVVVVFENGVRIGALECGKTGEGFTSHQTSAGHVTENPPDSFALLKTKLRRRGASDFEPGRQRH